MATDAYGQDLAYIHDAGFGKVAQAAGLTFLKALASQPEKGPVLDLGCGSGILSKTITDAGYEVQGYDISPAMIDLARQRVPNATFQVGSFLTVEIPSCQAVAAVGEVLNYLFDRGNTRTNLERFFRRIYQALRPGGIFLFDVATPGRVPGKGPQQKYVAGPDWAVLVTQEENDQTRRLTRKIISFRQTGSLYRRDEEIHETRLYCPKEITESLRKIGFRVRPLRHYGSLRLAPGHVAFLARKGKTSDPRPLKSRSSFPA